MGSQSPLNFSAALLIGAFLLDLAMGDPRWLPHPVVLMGKLVCHGERWLRSGNGRRDFSLAWRYPYSIRSTAARRWRAVALLNLLPLWLSFSANAALASTTLATAAFRRRQTIEGRCAPVTL